MNETRKKKERKLVWTDGNRVKSAKGYGVDVQRDEKGNILIIFHGHTGDIYLTPLSHGGKWMIL